MRQTRNSSKTANNCQSNETSQENNKATRKRSGRPQASRSPHMRRLIVEKSCNYLKTPTEISKELDIPRETVAGIIKRYEQTGSTSYQLLGGDLRSIIQEHHREFIVNAVDENNIITLAELKTKLVEQFSDIENIAISTLCRHLKYVERLTLKRSTAMEEKRNDIVTLQKRKDFVMSLQPEGILYNKNCIFIDEAGFNINMVKGRARAKAGERAVIVTKTKRAKNVTILFALSADGVESCHAKVVEGGTTGMCLF